MTTAYSADGRRFRFETPADSDLVAGDFIELRVQGGPLSIGQIDVLERDGGVSNTGSGTVLGTVDDHSFSYATLPFTSATMGPAASATLEILHEKLGASLPIGTLLSSKETAARLIPQRFNRHTFWCGQSGSGKTYALGVVLEQLLLQTSLPIVVLDPNADFVRLAEVEDPHGPAEELRERDIRILRPDTPGTIPLRARFTDLSLPAKAAVLRLDPLADQDAYNALVHFDALVTDSNQQEIIPKLLASDDPAARSLARRIENLGVIDWSVWAGTDEAATDIVAERPDATVLDLGGFAHPDEQLVVAMAVLDDLWARREERRPVLIVIDEAHNLCSPDGDSPLHRAVRERITQIAAEGRKFGLWLLLSTQRPSKVHPSIISQCDNLALMKMTSTIDLEELGRVFGFTPQALLAAAPRFRQGEALFAGGFVPAPTTVRMGRRLTPEGGSDVRVPLR